MYGERGIVVVSVAVGLETVRDETLKSQLHAVFISTHMRIHKSFNKVQLFVDKWLTVIASDKLHGYIVDDTEDWSISGGF